MSVCNCVSLQGVCVHVHVCVCACTRMHVMCVHVHGCVCVCVCVCVFVRGATSITLGPMSKFRQSPTLLFFSPQTSDFLIYCSE